MPAHIVVGQKVGPVGLIQHILPVRVTIRARQDAVVLRAEGQGGAVGIRVVEPEPTTQDLPVRLHFRQGTGKARITRVASSELRLAALHHAQCSRGDDATHEVATRLCPQQPRFIVVGIGRHQRVARGQIQERLVALQLLIAEHPEGRIPRPIPLDDRCRMLPERLTLGQDPVAFRHQRADLTFGLIIGQSQGLDLGKVLLPFLDHLAKLKRRLPDSNSRSAIAMVPKSIAFHVVS